MPNFFIVYHNFFILHSAMVYLRTYLFFYQHLRLPRFLLNMGSKSFLDLSKVLPRKEICVNVNFV